MRRAGEATYRCGTRLVSARVGMVDAYPACPRPHIAVEHVCQALCVMPAYPACPRPHIAVEHVCQALCVCVLQADVPFASCLPISCDTTPINLYPKRVEKA